MKIISLFSGAGGFDLGFKRAGFRTIFANDNSKAVKDTFKYNFPNIPFDHRNICDIPSTEIPDADGLIGGPPCQAWSNMGKNKGMDDERGRLFLEYIRILKDKQPKFFVAENVRGIISKTHRHVFNELIKSLEDCGYVVEWKLLNSWNFSVPQTRERVIIIGYRKDLGISSTFPIKSDKKPTLHQALNGLPTNPIASKGRNRESDPCVFPNHEYLMGSFSSRFMHSQRVRSWDEPSYTIIASGSAIPIHPQAPKMVRTGKGKGRIFVKGKEYLYRRFSVRECARIQTFPDDFHFLYRNILEGYRLVGNAVPVEMACCLAKEILKNLEG